jgi:cell shape-determining protein MreC
MEENKKPDSCLKLIVVFIILIVIIYVVLSVFTWITDIVGVVLSNPIVYYGLPVLILAIILYVNRTKK